MPVAAVEDQTAQKVGAIVTTILVHIGLALLLWALVVAMPKEKPPEIAATAIAPPSEKITKRQLPRQVQQKPSAPSQNVANIVTAATTATIAMAKCPCAWPYNQPSCFATAVDRVHAWCASGVTPRRRARFCSRRTE